MIRRSFLLGLAVASLAACSSSSSSDSSGSDGQAEGARVFGVEKAATANSAELTGVWESEEPLKNGPLSATTRFELRADSLSMAAHCSLDDNSEPAVSVGAKVSAQISASAISVKEAVKAVQMMGGAAECGVQLGAGNLPACAPATAAADRLVCFVLADGKLALYQTKAGVPTNYVKIAD
jgi:hypothetical protein